MPARAGQQRDAHRGRRETEHDEHAVRGEGRPSPPLARASARRGSPPPPPAGLHDDRERGHGARRERPESEEAVPLPTDAEAYGPGQSAMANDTIWTEATSATCAASSPTSTEDAPCSSPAPTGLGLAPHRGAGRARRERPRLRARHVERRAEQHRAPAPRAQGALRRPHRQDVDLLVRELRDAPDKPYVFHLGAQAHVGESWHRPYETVMANTIGTLNLPSRCSTGARAREVRHGRDVGGVRQRARRRRRPPHVRRRGRADPPRALADQPEVDLRDRQGRGGLPDDELLRRVRPARRRHAHVQQLRAAPEPALRHRDDRHAGAHPPRDRARRARPAARLLLLHGRRPRPPHRRRARQAGRRLRLRPGREHLDGRLGRPHHRHRHRARPLAGRPPHRHGRGPQAAGDERRDGPPRRAREAHPRDRLAAEVSWEDGVLRTIRWYAENRDRWIGRVDWLPTGAPCRSPTATR